MRNYEPDLLEVCEV